ncbi:hypothetical protein [Uliginosibacterium flavum]|uniref:Uncharacterized protein n=1 Tax=Uliginosibacterium flavum TaxID=1396831 RepID=A0ABV2TMU9_9RHOO
MAEVVFVGDTCDSALPAAVFDDFPVLVEVRTLDDLLATGLPVTLVAMAITPLVVKI